MLQRCCIATDTEAHNAGKTPDKRLRSSGRTVAHLTVVWRVRKPSK